MIFITGDTHRDYKRFSTDSFPEQKEMSKDDYVMIAGDFGIWSGDKKEDRLFNMMLETRTFTTLFIDGNHENYDLLKRYPVTEWHGGKAQFIKPSIIHLMRGQVYEIDGKTFFTFGGARSHDISGGIFDRNDPDFNEKIREANKGWEPYRILHESWWPEEMPNQEEMNEGIKNLKKSGDKVDFVITHECPTTVQTMLGGKMYQRNPLTDYLEDIRIKTDFKIWFFGHYHDNIEIPVGDTGKRYILLYEQIIRIA
jgi:predicted phosphodiesterase